jgi:hypothetical protein
VALVLLAACYVWRFASVISELYLPLITYFINNGIYVNLRRYIVKFRQVIKIASAMKLILVTELTRWEESTLDLFQTQRDHQPQSC